MVGAGALPPWGAAGANENESWVSLQSDSDWSETNFHLKFDIFLAFQEPVQALQL